MADNKPKLTYFAVRSLAEVIRLALSAAKVEYDEVYLRSREQFVQLITDGKLMFKQVPLLEIDGKTLIGSDCTLRYVCRTRGLMGKNSDDQTLIDMLSSGARDMFKLGIFNYKFKPTEEARAEFLEKATKECRERYLPVFERILTGSKSGFLVGDTMTMADIIFFDAVSYLQEAPNLKHTLAEFPGCQAFIAHFSQQPGIKEYLASPRRLPHMDDDMVAEVKQVVNIGKR
ncbi:glutathione S-transferase alpha-4-like [Diadema setosum]|uniref:glutathione S-transferase alpha-4-like n=1 Tax=Diadema setosum TaxID=31175 RepID=UPI003B3B39DB